MDRSEKRHFAAGLVAHRINEDALEFEPVFTAPTDHFTSPESNLAHLRVVIGHPLRVDIRERRDVEVRGVLQVAS